MHNIFMRDRAALVELFVDGSGVNRHFHNLASWFGRKYVDIPTPNPVDVNIILQTVRRIVEAMNLDSYWLD